MTRDFFDNNGQSLDRPLLWTIEDAGGGVSDERMRADKVRTDEKVRRFAELYPDFFDDLTRADVDVVAKCERIDAQIDREWFNAHPG